MLSSSRDKNKGVIIPWWGGERRARHVTPDLSDYWEGGRDKCERTINEKREKKKIKQKKRQEQRTHTKHQVLVII